MLTGEQEIPGPAPGDGLLQREDELNHCGCIPSGSGKSAIGSV